MSEFTERILIDAPPERVWAVLADIGLIARWNPGVVESSRLTAGPVEIGARRRCIVGGGHRLDEEVVGFDVGRSLVFRIIATDLPLAEADIRFALLPSGGACEVSVSPRYRPGMGVLGRLLDPVLLRPAYRRGMRKLLAGLKRHVQQSDA